MYIHNLYLRVGTVVNIKKNYFWQFFCEIDIQKSKKVGRCGQVGSDKERPKGRVGSGSDNTRGSTILNASMKNHAIEIHVRQDLTVSTKYATGLVPKILDVLTLLHIIIYLLILNSIFHIFCFWLNDYDITTQNWLDYEVINWSKLALVDLEANAFFQICSKVMTLYTDTAYFYDKQFDFTSLITLSVLKNMKCH